MSTSNDYENVSSDLIWAVVNSQHSHLVKRKASGGVTFSRDPLNLTNMHSRKYEGFVNDKAIGIQNAPAGEKGYVQVTLIPGNKNKPKSAYETTTYGSTGSIRKTYKSIVDSTTRQGYRADLRAEAVARVSALHQASRPKKDSPPKKPRGAKAKRAAAVEA